MDETAVMANDFRRMFGLCSSEQSHVQVASDEDTSHVTVAVTVCADGTMMTPYVIFDRTNIRPGVISEAGPHGKAYLLHSDKGACGGEQFLEYLKLIAHEIDDKRTKDGYSKDDAAVILLDGVETHSCEAVWTTILDMHKAMNVRNSDAYTFWINTHEQIEIYFFLPNATHVLQPLDTHIFACVKNKYRSLMEETMEENLLLPENERTKVDVATSCERFLCALWDVCTLHLSFDIHVDQTRAHSKGV